MLNESTFEGDDTYSFEAPLLQSGKSTDYKGREVDLTFDDVKQAYATLLRRSNYSIPLYERHFKDEVARLLKYRLAEEDGKLKIYGKGIVYDPKTYYDQYSQGFKFISPELTVTEDGGKIVDVIIDAAAMTIRPGMNPEMTTNKKMYFDAPADSTSGSASDSNNFNGEALLTNIQSKVDEIIEKMTTKTSESPKVTETKTSTEPVSPSFDASQMSELIKTVITDEIKKATTPDEPSKPIIDEKTAESISPELLQKFAEQQAELEKLKQTNKQFTEEKERQQKQQYADVLQKCRDLGVEKPESMVASADLSLDQKITLLQTFMAQFAKTSQMNKPSDQQMASDNPSSTKEMDNIDTIMQKLRVNPNNKQMREMLAKADCFDENGNFIEQVPFDNRGYM